MRYTIIQNSNGHRCYSGAERQKFRQYTNANGAFETADINVAHDYKTALEIDYPHLVFTVVELKQ